VLSGGIFHRQDMDEKDGYMVSQLFFTFVVNRNN
jgi:hypothetical protein